MEIKSLKGLEKEMAALHDNWLGKREGPNFLSSYNQWGFEPGISGVSAPGSGRAPRTRPRSERRQSRQPTDTRRGNSRLKNTPAHGRRVTRPFQSGSRRGSIHRETPLGTKELVANAFPCPLAQRKYRATGRNQGSANTRHLICLHQAPPTPCCRRSAHHGRACLSPSRRAASPRPAPTPAGTAAPRLGVV